VATGNKLARQEEERVAQRGDSGDDGGRRATAAADGVVWGRRQAAEAAEMGI